ncbi:hypothetical protein BU25DRAFT_483047 [Macroventuria anomochaeta]|uniref:Uncharacterized protein n=1 Tax=Macroventuria anomochaeta TaxID=301207 RepID=A0ACB6RI26_9PLEO|nr:uncharacterized protein BU25DRAFT_483047 [Macroventuria anomochaeta]KAF2621409.1 hypothetical protein BU25DRAFT_483047 [Macroventuria anomochaeta]
MIAYSSTRAHHQLKKGAEVMMLSAELMCNWIASLERANEAASAHKQRKKSVHKSKGS